MKEPAVQTINLATELRSGRHYGVFVDDTGSPGLVTPGLHSERKSWVAVLVPPHQIVEVLDQIPKALSGLKELGLEDPEFHFADIWAGRGEFNKLSFEQRLGIFRFMAHIFATYRFEILVQTFDPDNAREVQSSAAWPDKLGPLRFDDHEDLALIFLLLRIRLHLKARQGATACVVVDEGRLASGQAIGMSGLRPTFVGGAILFASSRLVHPVQLADFAAFAMNRSQLIRVKESLSELDRTLLEILTPIVELFVNIDSVPLAASASCVREGMN
jgi:hypothetical protein